MRKPDTHTVPKKHNRARQAQRKYAKPGAKLTIVGARRAPRRPRAIAYEITATSLRRKPESRACNLLDFRGEATGIGHWIPAFAGMTVVNWSICDSHCTSPQKSDAPAMAQASSKMAHDEVVAYRRGGQPHGIQHGHTTTPHHPGSFGCNCEERSDVAISPEYPA